MDKIETISLEQPEPLLDLRKVVAVLWGRRLLIVAIAGGMLLAAIGYMIVTRPVYTASAVVLVDPRETRTTTSADSALAGIGSDSAAISSQVAVIRSRQLLEQVFAEEGLATDPEFTGGGLVSRLTGLVSGRDTTPSDAARFDSFIRQLTVDREGLTYILNVGFRSTDPDKAARIVNAVVDRYVSSQVDEKSAANAAVADRLSGRIGALQQAVRDAESAVEDFKVANNIFDAGNGLTLLQAEIDQLNTQLLAAREVERQASGRLAQAEAAGTTPSGLQRLTEILSSTAAEKLRDDYNQKAAALANSAATLGPRHPTLVAQQAELRRVEALIVGEAERITSELRAAAELAAQNVTRAEAQIAETRAAADTANRNAVELRELERNAEAQRAVLDQFQRRSEETGQLESLQVSDIRVIGRATPPVEATWPRPMLILPLALVLGLALGAGLALLLGPKPARQARARVATRAPISDLPAQPAQTAPEPARATQQPAALPATPPPVPAEPAPAPRPFPKLSLPKVVLPKVAMPKAALPTLRLPKRKPRPAAALGTAKASVPRPRRPAPSFAKAQAPRKPLAPSQQPSVQSPRPVARPMPQAAHHAPPDRANVRAAADEIRGLARYARLD